MTYFGHVGPWWLIAAAWAGTMLLPAIGALVCGPDVVAAVRDRLGKNEVAQ